MNDDDKTGDLFGDKPEKPEKREAYARWSDPDTSHEAAETCAVTKLQAIVYNAVRAAGARGATGSEVCGHTGLPWNTVSPRFRPLAKKKLIMDSGVRRMGPYGKRQIVWVAM